MALFPVMESTAGAMLPAPPLGVRPSAEYGSLNGKSTSERSASFMSPVPLLNAPPSMTRTFTRRALPMHWQSARRASWNVFALPSSQGAPSTQGFTGVKAMPYQAPPGFVASVTALPGAPVSMNRTRDEGVFFTP